jgi:signal transduction histidine kinase
MSFIPTVRDRLTAWNVGVVACVLALSGIGVRYLLERGLIRNVDEDLTRQGHFWTGFVSRGPRPGPPSFERAADRGPNRPDSSDLRPRVLGSAGLDYRSRQPYDPDAFRRSMGGAAVSKTIQYSGQELRLLSLPGWRRGQIAGVVQVVQPLAPVHTALDELTRTLLISLPLALSLAGLGGAFLTWRALQPVRDITATAKRIDPQTLSARVPAEGNDEFAQLAGVLNGMLARLEDAFERQKRFTGDASHELRTPLATIKATSSLAREDGWNAEQCQAAMTAIEESADRAARIVEDLLILARSDGARLPVGREVISVEELLAHSISHLESAQFSAESMAVIELDPIGMDSLRVNGDSAHLERVFINLLENARRHTSAEGSIRVSARPSGEHVQIIVADTGEGIAAEHLPHLGERFYRVHASRERAQGAAGLGLAICHALVGGMGGTLRIESVVGRGTTVIVTLPLAPAEPSSAQLSPTSPPAPLEPVLTHSG